MGRRRRLEREAKLTAKELAEFRGAVEKMGREELEIAYKVHHNACRYSDMRVPPAQSLQEFVQVWKRLRKLKGSAMIWP